MGDALTVVAWRPTPPDYPGTAEYHDVTVYRGRNPVAALWHAVQAKRTAGCVRIEWRG